MFLHPVYNYSLVAYDPFALGAAGASMVRAAELLPGRFGYVFMAKCYHAILYKFFNFKFHSISLSKPPHFGLYSTGKNFV